MMDLSCAKLYHNYMILLIFNDWKASTNFIGLKKSSAQRAKYVCMFGSN